jgi:hypothetical protein
MHKYVKLVIVLLCISISACSSSKGPKDQQDFMGIVDKMQKDYSDAEKKHNRILEQEVVDEYKDKLFQASQNVENWTAEVKEVSDTFAVVIIAKHGDVKFKLVMLSPNAESFARGLKRGDEIVFSGALGHEGSFTGSGMVNSPEFAFKPKTISKKGDTEILNL